MNGDWPLHLFEGVGLELEYMIVDAETCSVLPAADELIKKVAGAYVSDAELGEVAWSNELVLHVIEFKTNGPARDLAPLPGLFQAQVARANDLLRDLGATVLPTAMHPWMDPLKETVLWPHEHSRIYEAFDRIFGCSGHGWSNLQSAHINLPFGDGEEFGRLHAAIRLVLPILPALAASSPILEGKSTGILDNRLDVYRTNCAKIPAVTGDVIPEPVFTPEDYREQILERMYRDIAPLDPEGVLREEFLNARGAIARFERGSIEIRLIDVQECPLADVSVAAAVIGTIRSLVEETWSSKADQQRWEVGPLASLLRRTTRDAERALIDDARYLEAFGLDRTSATAGGLWSHIIEDLFSRRVIDEALWRKPLGWILERGTLARRILAALDRDRAPGRLKAIYGRLRDCLAAGDMFV